MPNLLASLTALSNGLGAFERSLGASQNNVANVSTPGYARQSVRLTALPSDGIGGFTGGVQAGAIQSARDRYAELAVQRQVASLGHFEASASLLGSLNQILTINGDAGIPAGLNNLLQSFSAWSIAPQSPSARQNVVQQAEQFAAAVRSAANQVKEVATESESRLAEVTGNINTLGERIAGINKQRSESRSVDPALDTALYTSLDELAKLVNFSVLPGENGAVSVLLGGQTPLVVGEQAFALRGALVPPPDTQSIGAVQEWQFLDANGRDVTPQFSSGAVRGLLDVQNKTLPGLIGGQGQTGSLNELALGLAARVNQLLTAGVVSQSLNAVSGIPLFDFSSLNATQAAASLQLNQSVSTSAIAAQLAAIQAGPPAIANGVALELSAMLETGNTQNLISGTDFLSFYGRAASFVGTGLQTASDWKDRSEVLLAQADAIRQESSGVSLDEEAARIIELQRGYQAISRVVSMIDEMTDSLMGMLR